jgi:hypothetical protein
VSVAKLKVVPHIFQAGDGQIVHETTYWCYIAVRGESDRI